MELPEAPRSLINCTGFTPFPTIGLGPHGTADLARATWHSVRRALGRLLGPEPLFARSAMVHLGDGGLTCCFSNFGWALGLRMSTVPATDNQTAASGSLVPTPPAVVVRYLHPFSEVLAPASGIAVTFTPSNGTVGSGLLVTTVTTATDGTAATPWRLGTVGANLLIVTAAAAGSPDTIRATGTTPIL